MNTAKESTEILVYGQDIFERVYRGKGTKSLLVHLNDGVRNIDRAGIWEDRSILTPDAEAKKIYKEFGNKIDRKIIRRELRKEDIMQCVDWYLIAWELYDTGHGDLFEEMIFMLGDLVFPDETEHAEMLSDYCKEIRKYAICPDLRKILGYHIDCSSVKSVDHYLERANKGNDTYGFAQTALGQLYSKGLRGCVQDYAEAAKWYTEAAEDPFESLQAQHELGKLYASGLGVEQDDEKAVYWYLKAAESLTEAGYELGNMYAAGRGVARDDEQAVYWYRKPAEMGYMEPQYALGNMYAAGRGVAQDDEQAVYWYQKAAEGETGFAPAQYELGNRYATGCGVAQDNEQAVYWYRRAAEQGHTEAKEKLEGILGG